MSSSTIHMSNWSSLKREAATLEQYINQRLSSSSSSSSSSTISSSSSSTSGSSIVVSVDSSNAGSAGSFLDLEAARLREVDESIVRLSAVVEKLSAIASASGQASQLIATSTLQGVVHELRTEQRRQAGSLRVQREAAALMMRSNGSMAIGSTTGNSTMTDALLRERGALQGSHSALDEVLGRAAETQAALSRQRSAMSSATGRLSNISAKLPTLQDLMQAIQRRRSLNDYIVAGVMAACFIFTLWYMFGGSGQKTDNNINSASNVKKTL